MFGLPTKGSGPVFSEDLLIRCLVGMKSMADLQKFGCNAKPDNEPKLSDDGEITQNNQDDLINPVCLSGCLFVQNLLKFSFAYPTRVVTSLCTQSTERLLAWACHPLLSRVLEATLMSNLVPKERKTRLFNAFKVSVFYMVLLHFCFLI